VVSILKRHVCNHKNVQIVINLQKRGREGMVTRRGRRSKLIGCIAKIIRDAGEPLSAQEIMNRASHLYICPTMNQLAMMLRRHPEFVTIGTIRNNESRQLVKLYWLSEKEEERGA
tara:strand:+ start:395 stop:739 length:345 start_codon:yes stop_codon:yes gene_type:complete